MLYESVREVVVIVGKCKRDGCDRWWVLYEGVGEMVVIVELIVELARWSVPVEHAV